jgi:hypothetical protein
MSPCCDQSLLLQMCRWSVSLLCCGGGAVQDWTKLENEDSEGLVEVSYRSGSEPGRPPDIQVIQKQMAIVAWQPGPNRIVQVPTEVRGEAGAAGRATSSKTRLQ